MRVVATPKNLIWAEFAFAWFGGSAILQIQRCLLAASENFLSRPHPAYCVKQRMTDRLDAATELFCSQHCFKTNKNKFKQ